MRHFLPLLLNRKFKPDKCVVQHVLGKKSFSAIASVVNPPPPSQRLLHSIICVLAMSAQIMKRNNTTPPPTQSHESLVL